MSKGSQGRRVKYKDRRVKTAIIETEVKEGFRGANFIDAILI